MDNQKKPIVALIDLLGKKWVIRILWELNGKTYTFRELQKQCGDISPTIVNARLKELTAHKLVVKHEPSGYGLSELGIELLEHFRPLSCFAEQWQASVVEEEAAS